MRVSTVLLIMSAAVVGYAIPVRRWLSFARDVRRDYATTGVRDPVGAQPQIVEAPAPAAPSLAAPRPAKEIRLVHVDERRIQSLASGDRELATARDHEFERFEARDRRTADEMSALITESTRSDDSVSFAPLQLALSRGADVSREGLARFAQLPNGDARTALRIALLGTMGAAERRTLFDWIEGGDSDRRRAAAEFLRESLLDPDEVVVVLRTRGPEAIRSTIVEALDVCSVTPPLMDSVLDTVTERVRTTEDGATGLMLFRAADRLLHSSGTLNLQAKGRQRVVGSFLGATERVRSTVRAFVSGDAALSDRYPDLKN